MRTVRVLAARVCALGLTTLLFVNSSSFAHLVVRPVSSDTPYNRFELPLGL